MFEYIHISCVHSLVESKLCELGKENWRLHSINMIPDMAGAIAGDEDSFEPIFSLTLERVYSTYEQTTEDSGDSAMKLKG